jgi:DNA mismatch repair ATPase MutS
MWTTQWSFTVDAWRARVGPDLVQWLDAIGELEALLAFSTLAFEHPDYVWPDIVDAAPLVAAGDLAHPAMPAGAVANDLALGDGPVRLCIVSGSNMSGKSTWLRTIGANVVLALAGAPVRASRLRLSPVDIGAAISIQDSLADGRSKFYSEVRRLAQVSRLAEDRDGRVLFLFDEILGGTNSHDRRIGAEAVLANLVRRGAIGLATTHDLALGEMADRLSPAAVNVHFEDQFGAGGLTFDYRIRPGLVRTSNALALMRSVGLDV